MPGETWKDIALIRTSPAGVTMGTLSKMMSSDSTIFPLVFRIFATSGSLALETSFLSNLPAFTSSIVSRSSETRAVYPASSATSL